MPSSGSGYCGSRRSSVWRRMRATARLRTHLRSPGTTYHGRGVGRRAREGVAVGAHVVGPQLAVVEVAQAELPALVGAVDAVLQACALLLLGDVQEQLDDRRALVDEHPLELADVAYRLRHTAVGTSS